MATYDHDPSTSSGDPEAGLKPGFDEYGFDAFDPTLPSLVESSF